VIPEGASAPTTKPEYGYGSDDPLPSVPGVNGVIDRVEREIFGPAKKRTGKASHLMPLITGEDEVDPNQPMRTENTGWGAG
jgi:hypothetical protein